MDIAAKKVLTMHQLPPDITQRYRTATVREVHARSFGAVTAIRDPHAAGWKQRSGTLDDQAIFGPLRDSACACGKYQGRQHENTICETCGSKITRQSARRQRFGHIDLRGPIDHPLAPGAVAIQAIPVLPAAIVDSRGAKRLAELYDALVRSVLSESLDGVVRSFDGIIELLLPAVVVAHEWNLHEAELLAFGLVLIPRAEITDEACSHCGYPLEGLDVADCPGCGQKRG